MMRMQQQQVVAVEGGVVVSNGGGMESPDDSSSSSAIVYERVAAMASGSAVVVFSASGCCMCHVVKRLLLGLGVGPAVYELDQLGGAGREIQAALAQLLPGSSNGGAVVPVVFVGGRLLGGVDKVMACHINGSLVPLLKDAGALWL
ncbi:glutaredoxin-C9 [Brachypodium distachyon]|uniref:Glutaredoxin domain-containing protein n=1 Tax=Brachypodium distachyon TaxID=15368 RepID=A0A0Q3HDS9_BRADI|nr:glutaredoxin-C9 [Brachypodium distachyon]KQK21055.1 hypothetical protein BRADI_1g58420v3 [Brachypodium distachyon]|eukprot:XP_003561465.2 glutaredoxin-C9 [Brachypodium distachyon]